MDEFRASSHNNRLKRGKKRLKMLCRWAQKSKFTSRRRAAAQTGFIKPSFTTPPAPGVRPEQAEG